MRLTTFFAVSSLATVIVACRSDSKSNPDAGNGSNGSGGDVTVQQVQDEQMPPGTPVTLRGVVVTAIDNFGSRKGDIWVEEPQGGEFSGIHVFGASTTDVAALAVGDLVDVTGAVKDEFAGSGDSSGRTVTELKAASAGSLSVKKVGTGTLPAPVSVNALMIGQIPDADANPEGPNFSAAWEKYEGVLVEADNVSALGGPNSFGSGSDQYAFGITGVAQVEGNMTDLTTTGVRRSSCLNVTGVVDYFRHYLVLPRSSTDIVENASATSCPPPEADMATCTDAMDNDGNGFADCNDIGCIVGYGPGPGTCRQVSTVSAINVPATPPTGGVELDNVYVLAVSFNKKNLWVSDTLASGQNKGIYVAYGTTLDTNIVPGAKVTVIGKAKDFTSGTSGPEREINAYSVAFNSAPTAQPVAITGTTAATLSDRSYVGTLVTLTNVKLTSVVDPAHFVDQAQQGATMFFTDDDIFRLTETPSTSAPVCFASITGIWSYQVFNNGYALLPTADGVTTGGNCP